MSQARYIESFFQQYDFQVDTGVNAPILENLLPAEEESGLTDKQVKFVDNFPYQHIIGYILYVNVCTMPTASYAVSKLSQFNKNPTYAACKAVMHQRFRVWPYRLYIHADFAQAVMYIVCISVTVRLASIE